MLVKEFDYKLPQELIAQYPPGKRGASRLMVLNRELQKIEHRRFYNIVDYLKPEDVLVLNETKVISARLIGKRVKTGGKVEVFLLRKKTGLVNQVPTNATSKNVGIACLAVRRGFIQPNEWEVLVSPGRAKKSGVKISFGPDFSGEIQSTEGHCIFKFDPANDFDRLLYKYGQIPLPPYIKRAPEPEDSNRYQTIYAKVPGACAAPTAGLHFTQELLSKVESKGVKIVNIVLHTGIGSFKPIKCERVVDHQMESEYYEIPKDAAYEIKHAKRVVAVGTGTVRALETAVSGAYKKWTDKFIYPGYKFKIINALITNFHLPKSTLILLVSAFAGKEFVFKAYQKAINKGYKFYSYGDAMLII